MTLLTSLISVSHFVSLLSVCLTRHCYHQHHKHLLQSWKQKLLSIWGHHLNLQKPTGPGRKVKYQQEATITNTINSFPISHWSARDKPNRVNRSNRVENNHKPRDSGERVARSCSSAVSPSAVARKRLSLQNEVINLLNCLISNLAATFYSQIDLIRLSITGILFPYWSHLSEDPASSLSIWTTGTPPSWCSRLKTPAMSI